LLIRIVSTKEEAANRSLINKKQNSKLKGNENMAVEKAIGSSSLVEVIDRILDKGVVVDAWVRVSLVGIEILAIEARVVVASVETYLKYAEAIGLTATAA
jgi:gas vesicle structural protein